MRIFGAIAALALFCGCSSGGPSRPTPPGNVVPAPLVIRWEAPTENTDGTPLTDVARYEITVAGPGQAPTALSESPDTRELVVPVTSRGTWTVTITAISASTGAGETAEQQVAR